MVANTSNRRVFYLNEQYWDKGHHIRHHDLEEALVAIALGYLRVEGKL